MNPSDAIATILNPRSIALVGATEGSGWSTALVNNLRTLGYEGRVHFVHPRYPSVFGAPCHPSVAAIGEPVDCAYVMTATAAVAGVIDDLAAASVPTGVILAADYKETGPEGLQREVLLVERCRALGVTVQGPNCLGFVNYLRRVPAFALPLQPPLLPGRVGVLTQSGAMLLHLHRLAYARGIGLSYNVSSGNEAMLDACDWLSFLLDDPSTSVVAALLEGIRSPARFLSLCERAIELGKPLVVLKVGGSEAGSRSALAHTGALAGEDRVTAAVFEQRGVVRVETPEELIETAALLASPRLPEGPRAAIITASGGASGIVSDLAAATRLEVPDFSASAKSALGSVLPAFATPQNPLDVTGLIVQQMELLPQAMEVIGGEGFDLALVVWDPPREPGVDPARTENRLRATVEAVRGCPIPCFVTSYVAGDLTEYGRSLLREHDQHFANGMALGVKALDSALGWTAARRHLLGRPRPSWKPPPRPALPERRILTEAESLELLGHYGVPVPPLLLAHSPSEAGSLAEQCGLPAVLKVQSPDVPHKTEAGGVRLNLLSRREVERAYAEVVDSVLSAVPGARLSGVLVARQVFPAAELLAGIVSDAVFGPVLMVGIGGIFVEVLDDVAIRLPPIDFDEAVGMLRSLRGYALLEGPRGMPRADLHAAAACLVRLSRMAVELGDVLEAVDVNPLFVLADGDGALTGDALVILK